MWSFLFLIAALRPASQQRRCSLIANPSDNSASSLIAFVTAERRSLRPLRSVALLSLGVSTANPGHKKPNDAISRDASPCWSKKWFRISPSIINNSVAERRVNCTSSLIETHNAGQDLTCKKCVKECDCMTSLHRTLCLLTNRRIHWLEQTTSQMTGETGETERCFSCVALEHGTSCVCPCGNAFDGSYFTGRHLECASLGLLPFLLATLTGVH